MKQILYMNPVLRDMIWGGKELARFGYSLPSEHVGECWGIAAHPHGCCTVRGGRYDGRRLDELWRDEPALFGREEGDASDFPLLIKLIDAHEDLSIQVHPDDAYADAHENGARGKTECWYVLDAVEGASIIIGHNAATPGELREMIEGNRFGDLIREIPVKKGDFFQIEPGTVHAIKKGTLLLETQENSDVTYRLYDYDRLQNGVRRKLHRKECLDVIRVPFAPSRIEPETARVEDAVITRFVKCRFYTVYHIDVNGGASIPLSGMFHTVSVLEGQGYLDGSLVQKGDHLILAAGYGTVRAVGCFKAVVTRV